ncbi:MAG: PAS domain-containing protein [Armatimonadetes bacterium]|nr:PAS domain-containing protein [Armatimonadota bacterium]
MSVLFQNQIGPGMAKVLSMGALGKSDEEIASTLGMTAAGVAEHWRNLDQVFHPSIREGSLRALAGEPMGQEIAFEDLKALVLYEAAERHRYERLFEQAKAGVGLALRSSDSSKRNEFGASQQVKVSYLSNLMETMPMAVYRVEGQPPFRILFAFGSAGAKGWSDEDFTSGKIQVLDLMHPEDLPIVIAGMESHAKAGREFSSFQYRFREPEGGYRWELDAVRTHYAADGSVESYTVVTTNITDLVESGKWPTKSACTWPQAMLV